MDEMSDSTPAAGDAKGACSPMKRYLYRPLPVLAKGWACVTLIFCLAALFLPFKWTGELVWSMVAANFICLAGLFWVIRRASRDISVAAYSRDLMWHADKSLFITGLFGDDSAYLVMLFLFISFHPAMFFSTYRLFFDNRTKEEVNWKRIVHPALIMTLIALTIRLAGGHRLVPGFVITQFSLIGAMALPLVMIILGGNIFMDFKQKGRIRTREVLKFVLVKNFVFPLVFLSILLAIRPPYPIAMIIFLQSTVPPITAIPIVTQRQGGDFAITNQFIVASYLTLLVSVPVMFSLFSVYFPLP